MNVIACIDSNAMACNFAAMCSQLITQIESFLAETGLSAHRFGMLAAKNGRLVDRLRSGGRIWPETEVQISNFLLSEEARRRVIAKQEWIE